MKNARVQVAVRIRPMLESERKRGEKATTKMSPDGNGILVSNGGRKSSSYQFDKVLDPQLDQDEVYETTDISSYLNKVIDGYHATIFAYGQTGSGKTHTMEGYRYNKDSDPILEDGEHVGIVPRAIGELFD